MARALVLVRVVGARGRRCGRQVADGLDRRVKEVEFFLFSVLPKHNKRLLYDFLLIMAVGSSWPFASYYYCSDNYKSYIYIYNPRDAERERKRCFFFLSLVVVDAKKRGGNKTELIFLPYRPEGVERGSITSTPQRSSNAP